MRATLDVVVIRGILRNCITRRSVLNFSHGLQDAVCVSERGRHSFPFLARSEMADQVVY